MVNVSSHYFTQQHHDLAEIRKRLAETLLKLGDEEGARTELQTALRSRPSLKGVQRLCARLGIRAAAL